MKKNQTNKTKQKVAKKSVKSENGAQKSECAISQVLLDEINAYTSAHNRLVRRLIASSDNPMLIMATLHAIHSISMNFEQEEFHRLMLAKVESNGQKREE